jgi:hypothetical protein
MAVLFLNYHDFLKNAFPQILSNFRESDHFFIFQDLISQAKTAEAVALKMLYKGVLLISYPLRQTLFF